MPKNHNSNAAPVEAGADLEKTQEQPLESILAAIASTRHLQMYGDVPRIDFTRRQAD